jgi:hypothetical protein
MQVLVAYRDIAAGQRAVSTISHLAKGRVEAPGDLALRVQFWRFDLLLHTELRILASADFACSEVIVIADSSDLPMESEIQRWLSQGLDDRRDQDTAVVALLGPPKTPDGPDSTRWQFIRTAVQDAGLHFFAPLPQTSNSSILRIEQLQRRAEALTPTLDHILQCSEPVEFSRAHQTALHEAAT